MIASMSLIELGRYAGLDFSYMEDSSVASSDSSFVPQAHAYDEFLKAHPVALAPMAGITDSAYRLLMRAGGAELCFTEMVSCAGLHFGPQSWELAAPDPQENLLGVQLFGSKPELFAEATEGILARFGNDIQVIDINMACPVQKVVKRGEGCALMDTPDLAERIVAAAVKVAGGVPVTVKIRRGRRFEAETAPEFAQRLEAAGASAIAVHGRFGTQLYRGEADWSLLSRVAAAVNIPVIGSGDVWDAASGRKMLATTPVSGILVARGSYGNPWIFSDLKHTTETQPSNPTPLMRLYALACYVRLLDMTGNDLHKARSGAAWFFKGFPDASSWRHRAMSAKSFDDFCTLIEELLALVPFDE